MINYSSDNIFKFSVPCNYAPGITGGAFSYLSMPVPCLAAIYPVLPERLKYGGEDIEKASQKCR